MLGKTDAAIGAGDENGGVSDFHESDIYDDHHISKKNEAVSDKADKLNGGMRRQGEGDGSRQNRIELIDQLLSGQRQQLTPLLAAQGPRQLQCARHG